MNIQQMKVADLRPFSGNAKKHDDTQIKNVMQSIKEYGIVQPLVCDKDNILIIGHCRLLACKRLGIKEVPVVRMEELTEEEANKLRLLDNKLNESEWDFELLAEQVPDLDFSDFDIDWGIPEDLEDDIQVVEDEPPEDPPTLTKSGDIWILGRHRLLVGDSTDASDVEMLMEGQRADMLLTDPPYNVAYEGSNGKTIQNDNMADSDFRQFLRSAFKTADGVMKEGAPFYIWHADSEGYNFRGACHDIGWQVRQCLIWAKNSLVLGRQDYQWRHEPCLYGWKDGAGHYFIDDRKQNTVFEDKTEINPRKMKKEELVAFVEKMLSDKTSTTVIHENKPSRNDEHPTMKPIALLARLIKNSSRPQQIILDTFGGSGSTLIACEQLGRNCYTAELDPKYADVIVQRWLNFTGIKDQITCIRDGQEITYDEASARAEEEGEISDV